MSNTKLSALRDDFRYYAKNCLSIVTKDGNKTPFVLNEAQEIVYKALIKQYEETGKIRAIIVKARQMGISTLIEGMMFHRTTMNQNMNTFICSHLAESTSSIFKMTKTFLDNLPHETVKPSIGMQSASGLYFDDINSSFRVGTARSKTTGRGMTLQNLHASEPAYWDFAEDITAGLLQAVGRNSWVVFESTANGLNWFHDQVKQAELDESEWQVIFVPWSVMEEYQQPSGEDFVLSDEEQYLVEQYKVSNDQLAWRRNKILELGDDKFKQEYPINVNEAFIYSGRPFVEERYITAAEEEVFQPDMIGDFDPLGQFIPRSDKKGPYKQWGVVDRGVDYCIGVDVAEGRGGDYSCAQVVNEDGEQVAVWHGYIDPFEFGDKIQDLARHWNYAYVIVERNNHGISVCDRLRQLDYKNLYQEETWDRRYEGRKSPKIGFTTTAKSKPLIVDNLASLLRLEESGIVDLDLVKELRTYQIDDNGTTNAAAGCYDDRVMAYCLALFGLRTLPKKRPVVLRDKFEPLDKTIGY